MKTILTDGHGRVLNYLRFAVTDRCNLRCQYCMPEEGIDWIKRNAIANKEECLRILRIFQKCGVNKVRFTGGEPFMRDDFGEILLQVSEEKLFESVHLTTNGTLCGDLVHQLPKHAISGVNLSIDSLDPNNYFKITRRNSLDKAIQCLHLLLSKNIPVKVNMVVLQGCNTHEIIPMAELTKTHPIEVRFIEEMPFNGTGKYSPTTWGYDRILSELQTHFHSLHQLPFQYGQTAKRYVIEGHKGTIGVIAAWSRNFCGQCNRIRLTPSGQLRTCLYAKSGLSVLDEIREGKSDEDIIALISSAIQQKHIDGFAAEQEGQSQHVSMAHIGG